MSITLKELLDRYPDTPDEAKGPYHEFEDDLSDLAHYAGTFHADRLSELVKFLYSKACISEKMGEAYMIEDGNYKVTIRLPTGLMKNNPDSKFISFEVVTEIVKPAAVAQFLPEAIKTSTFWPYFEKKK